MYNLPVFLTDVELGCYSKQQAELWTKWGRLNQQKKDSAAVYKKQIDAVEGELDEVSRIVEEGSEERPVKCFWMFDYAANEKALYREDTMKEVERRTLTKEEIERYQNPELGLEESVQNVTEAFAGACTNTECGSYDATQEKNCVASESVTACEFYSTATEGEQVISEGADND